MCHTTDPTCPAEYYYKQRSTLDWRNEYVTSVLSIRFFRLDLPVNIPGGLTVHPCHHWTREEPIFVQFAF